MTLSVYYIVKNEEAHLEASLRSIAGLWDELLIVDTGSTDRTKDIARDFGARIIDFSWCDDFAAARNAALVHCTQEWILSMDADDVVPASSYQVLQETFRSDLSAYDLGYCPYIYNALAETSNIADTLRFWRNALGLRYIYPVHEVIDTSAIPEHRRLHLSAPISHNKPTTAYAPSARRNLAILQAYFASHGPDKRMLYYAVHDAYFAGNFSQAVLYAELFEATYQQTADPAERGRVAMYKGRAHMMLGDSVSARSSATSGIAICPLPELFILLGDSYVREGNLQQAIEAYQHVLKSTPAKQSYLFQNTEQNMLVAHTKLAHLYELTLQHYQACIHAEAAIAKHPKSAHLFHFLDS